jgi:hypothetical protein
LSLVRLLIKTTFWWLEIAYREGATRNSAKPQLLVGLYKPKTAQINIIYRIKILAAGK